MTWSPKEINIILSFVIGTTTLMKKKNLKKDLEIIPGRLIQITTKKRTTLILN